MSIRDLIPWSRQENKVPAQVSAAGAASDPVLSLHREVNRLFEDVFRGFGVPALAGVERGLLAPSVELAETDKEIRVTAELPGLDEKDVEVKVVNRVLTIKGEKKEESEEQRKDYHLSERRYGSFQRSFQLPQGVDAEKIEASFSKGLLTVKLPKTAEAKNAERKIAVQAK